MRPLPLAFIAALLAASPASYAVDFTLKSGKATYEASYVTKTVQGTSTQLIGKLRCESDRCDFLVAAPVKSFDSGNANRDSHMLESVKGLQFPHASVSGKVTKTKGTFSDFQQVKVTLAGVTADYPEFTARTTSPGCGAGHFILKLSRHSIERPSLLGIKIKDDVPVDFEGCFTE